MNTINLMLLTVLCLAFVITHIGMSAEPFRSRTVMRLGEIGFRGVYSLVSLITLGGAIWVLRNIEHDRMGPLLWDMPDWMVVAPLFLMLLAIILLVFGMIQRSPTGMTPASMEPKGITRVTRHPVNMSLALFGLAHMITNGYLGQVVFFGSFLIVGFCGAYHQDKRKSRELDTDFAEYKITTSVFPFAAILLGRTKLDRDEFNRPLLLVCLIIWLGVFIFHRKMFGVGFFG